MRKHIRECDILLTSIQDNKEWGRSYWYAYLGGIFSLIRVKRQGRQTGRRCVGSQEEPPCNVGKMQAKPSDMQVNRAVQGVPATGGSWLWDRSGLERQVGFCLGGLGRICNGVSKDIFSGSFIVGYHYCDMSSMAKIFGMLIWLTAKESKCGD